MAVKRGKNLKWSFFVLRKQEAHFLIEKKNKKASHIYLDLGFESLSHFSYAFKKQFGLTPTELAERNIHAPAPEEYLLP